MLKLRLAWWNTSLAPRAKSRTEPALYARAAQVMEALLSRDGVDVLALGEITDADLRTCLSRVTPETSRLQFIVPESGQTDRASAIAVGYRSDKLKLVGKLTMSEVRQGTSRVTAQHLKFQPAGDEEEEEPLHVIVVHWPSRLGQEFAEQQRVWMGSALNRTIEALPGEPSVVVMGDFNDEPFSRSLTENLFAYRDRTLVRRRRGSLYNPFWRLLGEQQHVEHEQPVRHPAGTHFYGSGPSTWWFTFDQIMVSASLIGAGPWRLIEGETRVWREPSLLTEKGRIDKPFDHLPVLTALTYERS